MGNTARSLLEGLFQVCSGDCMVLGSDQDPLGQLYFLPGKLASGPGSFPLLLMTRHTHLIMALRTPKCQCHWGHSVWGLLLSRRFTGPRGSSIPSFCPTTLWFCSAGMGYKKRGVIWYRTGHFTS